MRKAATFLHYLIVLSCILNHTKGNWSPGSKTYQNNNAGYGYQDNNYHSDKGTRGATYNTAYQPSSAEQWYQYGTGEGLQTYPPYSPTGFQQYGGSGYGKSGYGSSSFGHSGYGLPSFGNFGYGFPSFGNFGYGMSSFGKSSYGFPWFGSSGIGFPSFGISGYGFPWFGNSGYGSTWMGSSGFGFPWFGSSGYGFPGYGTGGLYYPLYAYPLSYMHNGYHGHYGVYQRYGFGNIFGNGIGYGRLPPPFLSPLHIGAPHYRKQGILEQLGLGGEGLTKLVIPALLVAAIVKG